jgi:hypothetical protein
LEDLAELSLFESDELDDELEDESLELDELSELSELLEELSVAAVLVSLVEESSLLADSTGGLGRP